MIATDAMLLERLKDTDAHDVWRVFYEQYWASIHRYGRKLGLNDTQAEEVLQDTMVTLMHVLPEFTYDPRRGRFRNFLLTIVHRKALGVMRRQVRERTQFDSLADAEARMDKGVQEEHEECWRERVVASVIEELRADPELDDRTRAVFEVYVLRQLAGREVAMKLGISENLVHQTKCRLLRRLRASVQRRLRDSGTDFA